jgi:hypothetical protein
MRERGVVSAGETAGTPVNTGYHPVSQCCGCNRCRYFAHLGSGGSDRGLDFRWRGTNDCARIPCKRVSRGGQQHVSCRPASQRSGLLVCSRGRRDPGMWPGSDVERDPAVAARGRRYPGTVEQRDERCPRPSRGWCYPAWLGDHMRLGAASGGGRLLHEPVIVTVSDSRRAGRRAASLRWGLG